MSNFFTPTTSKVLSVFTKALKALDDVIEHHNNKAADATIDIKEANDAYYAATQEAALAAKVKAQLQALLS